MKKVNLRDLYPDVYKNDYFVEVTEDVLETIRAAERAEAAYDRRMYRYKAYYSLNCDNGIENAILMKPQTPEMLLEEKQLREQLYAAVMALPEKQAKRIYARYYLGMRVSEIATAEGVDPSRVRDSIRRGLKQLAKYFRIELQMGARSQSASGTGPCAPFARLYSSSKGNIINHIGGKLYGLYDAERSK